MEKNLINDVRSEFKNITCSKFQKSKAKQELIQCIYKGKIENANYWSAELICAGHYNDLWNIIIQYCSRYIHTANPKLIFNQVPSDQELSGAKPNAAKFSFDTGVIFIRNRSEASTT